MERILEHSRLSSRCIADLHRIYENLKDQSRQLSGGYASYDYTHLPRCTDELTSAKAAITKKPIAAHYHIPASWRSANTPRAEARLFKSVEKRLEAADATGPSATGKRRAELPLSAKEQDFIYRYAEFKHGKRIQRSEDAHTRSQAYRAYTDAFLSYAGRPPSVVELQEVDRLQFVEYDGRVGIMQQPHAPMPHNHFVSGPVKVCSCAEQVQPPLAPSSSHKSPSHIRPGTSPSIQRSPRRSSVKKNCTVCGARLPPRLVKNICPACDK
jgi:hypothetical protein